MRSFLLVVVLMTSSIPGFSRQRDDLQKYSYLLVGIKIVDGQEMFYPQGTCFFIRQSGKLLLVTAKHCINGYDVFKGKKAEVLFDFMAVRYYTTGSTMPKYRNFGSLTALKNQLQDYYFYESPDLLVLDFNAPDIEPNINSIEKFLLDGKKPNGAFKGLHSFGFGMSDPSNLSHTTQSIYYEGTMADIKHIDPYYPINDSLYYVAQPKAIQGMSGSPIFSSYIHPSLGRQYYFNGVIFGSNNNYNAAYIINPSVVKSHLDNYR